MSRWFFNGCGVLLALTIGLTVGCTSSKDEYREFNEEDAHAEAEHGHHHHGHGEGPHGGHLVEIGDEQYHAEVAFDPETRKVTIWLTGPDASTPAAASVTDALLELEVDGVEHAVALVAVPAEGEAEGKVSQLEGDGTSLPEAIKSEENFDGHLHLTIDGTEFVGHIHHGDDGHDHDYVHDHDEAKKSPQNKAKPAEAPAEKDK